METTFFENHWSSTTHDQYSIVLGGRSHWSFVRWRARASEMEEKKHVQILDLFKSEVRIKRNYAVQF